MAKNTKLKLLAGVVLPVAALVFIVSERIGYSDRWFGLHHVTDVAERYETSYDESVDMVIGPDEPAWRPLLRLINKYSTADLPTDREPKVLGRTKAVSSAKINLGPQGIAEWTAPSTPMLLIYTDWPGQRVEPKDYRVVGTIGDLRSWVQRSKADFKFLVQDVLIGVLAVALAVLVWFGETRSGRGAA